MDWKHSLGGSVNGDGIVEVLARGRSSIEKILQNRGTRCICNCHERVAISKLCEHLHKVTWTSVLQMEGGRMGKWKGFGFVSRTIEHSPVLAAPMQGPNFRQSCDTHDTLNTHDCPAMACIQLAKYP